MKMLATCVMAAALAALAACGQTETADRTDVPGPAVAVDQPPAPPIPTDATAGPSGTDTMTWHYFAPNSPNVGTGSARLLYASYGSEGMVLNLQCDSGTVYARLVRGQQRETWPFSLQSGTARANLTGTTESGGEVVVTGTLPLSAPVMTAFRASGDLTLIDGDRTTVMDAINEQERQTIAQFFAACA